MTGRKASHLGLPTATCATTTAPAVTPPAIAPMTEALEGTECLALVGSRSIGRVGHGSLGVPELVPVHYRVHERAIVFRTDNSGVLAAVMFGAMVFEVDAIDPDYRTGWTVVIRGEGEEVWRPEDLLVLRRLPLRPATAAETHRFVRFWPRDVAGWRLV